uniref:hypothetical protein n=1 Tax=Edaphosphingomonas laterariae TaxID=861865 RepID=UPI001181AA4B|nr:hypothetical protein [Sphingomonas laterariae]
MRYLKKDSIAGRLIYRRSYPEPLRPFLPGISKGAKGPRELVRSLKARDITEPGALDLYRAAAAEYDLAVAHARKAQKFSEKQARGEFDTLSAETVAYLAKVFEAEWHAREERDLAAGGAAWAEQARHGWQYMLDEFREWRVEQDLYHMEEWWADQARELCAAQGYALAPDDRDGLLRLCAALNDVAIIISDQSKARLRGNIVPVPAAPPRPERREPPTRFPKLASAAQSFEAIVERLLETERLGTGQSTKEAARTGLRFFREVHGQPAPSAITKQMVSEWLDMLAQRPAKLDKSEMALPLSEVVARYEGRKDIKRLSSTTLEKYLRALNARWAQAQDEEGLIADGLPNPFSRKRVTAAPHRKPVAGLGRETLDAIFALPIFTAGERPTQGKGEACYWLPLLMLWTGCRPEEAAQLIVDDISVDPVTGHPTLAITGDGEHPEKGPRRLKTAKRSSGERTIHIPRPLLDLNFLAYVAAVRAAGHAALFPKLRTKGKRGLLFSGFSGWWSAYLRDHGVLPKGDGPRPSREFRHVWTTAAREAGIPREAREYIQGHVPDKRATNDTYGDREALGRAARDIAFPKINLSKVRPWRKEDMAAD